MARKRRNPPEGLLFDKGSYTERFKDLGIDPDTLSKEDYAKWVQYLDNLPPDPPELVSPKGQLSLEDMYDRGEARRALEGATRRAQETNDIRKFAAGKGPEPLKGPGVPPPTPEGADLSFVKRFGAGAKLRPASDTPPIPKGKWQKAGLLKGLGGKAGKIGRGVGFGIGAAALALEGVDLLQGPAEGIYDYFTKDPVEEQGKMLRAREQLIRERQRQQEKSRETQRLRMINMQKIAQLNPQLAMELSVGRILPKGAAVIGGKPRTDALDAIADAMAEGTLDPSVPDPLSGVM